MTDWVWYLQDECSYRRAEEEEEEDLQHRSSVSCQTPPCLGLVEAVDVRRELVEAAVVPVVFLLHHLLHNRRLPGAPNY